MPHFIIECSENILESNSANKIIETVYDVANSTGLFATEGISGVKVRIKSYSNYTTVATSDDFIHVFAHIMEGRTKEQKANLSQLVVSSLSALLPSLKLLSMNVIDIDKSSYVNLSSQ